MYDLVADVEKYPEFVPLCKKLVVRSSREKLGRTILLADMTVAYRKISETFTSRVVLNPASLEIDVNYVDGPFKYLENKWRFYESSKHACDVSFQIDYEFKSKALGVLMGTMFDLAFSKFTTAFEQRANEIYAK